MNAPRFLRTFFFVFIFLLCVAFLHTLGTFEFIERPLVSLLHRGTTALYTIRVSIGSDSEVKQLTGPELEAAYIALQDAYTKQTVDRASLLELQEENENLKKQVQFFSDKKWTYYTGRITGKQIDPFESSVMLFFEHADKYIPLGAPAITEDGIFVGTVAAVEGNIVSIRLLTDARTKVGAALLTDEHTIGVLEGGFGKSTRINSIPQNEKIATGDIIVTSGLIEQIPYGLPIGTVAVVEKEPYEPFQSATMTPLVSPNALQILSIIVNTPIE